MSILSNSIYGSSTNKGMGGLLSGLDTDDLVTQMTAATRNKINRQYQAKQKLLYRQEAYREVSTKLLAFSNKYLSYSTGSKTNILSSGFFDAYTYKSSSSYVNISGNADSIKNFQIDSIDSVASAASFASGRKVSGESISTYDKIPDEISRLSGETFSVTYDGKTYNLSISKDFKNEGQTLALDDVSNELNNQLKSIKDEEGKSIIPDSVKFDFTGEGVLTLSGGAYLSAGSSEFLDVLKMKTGEDEGKASTGSISEDDLIKKQSDVLANSKDEEYITFDYNGSVKQIGLGSGIKDIEELGEYLQTQLNKEFGSGKIKVNYDNGSDHEKISFSTPEDNNVLKINSVSRDLSKLTGLESGDINRIKKDVAIGDSGISNLNAGEDGKYSITINDKTLEFEKTATFNDIVAAINNDKDMNITVKYSDTTDKFSIVADETGEHTGIKINYDGAGSLANALFGIENNLDEKGTDTEMTYTMNGVTNTVKRSTSNFTIDDISLDLNKNAQGLGTDKIPVTFDVTNNIDEVVDRVRNFINEYNEIITLIGNGTSQRPNRSYEPLTPDQLDEMKEQEISDWNIEAKKGVLYSDSKMTRVLSDLRSAMGGTTDTSSLTLAQIGISPAYMDTSGKLVMDEDKFKQKLMEDPKEVASLFSGALKEGGTTAGIASQLRDILVRNVGISGTSGVLVEEAGMDSGLTSDKNIISDKIKDYDEKMAELKKALQAEREKYWNQFSALEQSLNQLNAQSSWLTDMMGN